MICAEHLTKKKCESDNCLGRHPKNCKWDESRFGCKRADCLYLHKTKETSYQCAGCKDIWVDENCVVQHYVKNRRTYFCLNCDDWIKDKNNVFEQGWALLDEEGYLRIGV